MRVREPIVAGQFYPSDPETCLEEVRALTTSEEPAVGGRPLGGLVPHAGYMCSGAVAGRVLATLAAVRRPRTVVLFGGVHRYGGRHAAAFVSGRWETPLGPVKVNERLAERILGHTNIIVDDAYAHEEEHSIEVQLPFLRHLFPEAEIVPIMVPATEIAHEVGEAVARTVSAYQEDVVIVGTTDLTHYGPHYGYIPHGVGEVGARWAQEQNDPRFIKLVCAMKAEELVEEAQLHKNACSPGAAAATVSAATGLGATRGVLLSHTSSAEVLRGRMRDAADNCVGYAGIVFA